jgi:hypothetical protein
VYLPRVDEWWTLLTPTAQTLVQQLIEVFAPLIVFDDLTGPCARQGDSGVSDG